MRHEAPQSNRISHSRVSPASSVSLSFICAHVGMPSFQQLACALLKLRRFDAARLLGPSQNPFQVVCMLIVVSEAPCCRRTSFDMRRSLRPAEVPAAGRKCPVRPATNEVGTDRMIDAFWKQAELSPDGLHIMRDAVVRPVRTGTSVEARIRKLHRPENLLTTA
jgi:hypothetical protein